MEPKVQISSQIIVRPQEASKIMMGSAVNFKRKLEPSDTFTRPLMVDAWSQTKGDNIEEQTERDTIYIERIRKLEIKLGTISELLSQIHATSDRTAQLQVHSSPALPPPPPPSVQSAKPIQMQTEGSQSSTQVADKTPQLSINTLSSNNLPTSSVMNPRHSLASTNTESIKYTIIAEGSGDDNGEPIEIQLAEEDGSLYFNSSADSGRLEIYLDPQENVEIKTESDGVASQCTAEQDCIKIRKEGIHENNALVRDSASCSTSQGLSTNSGEKAVTNNIAPQYQSRKSRLLNTYKLESYNCSADIQTTPVQPIKPSPDKKVSPLSGRSVVGGKPMERRIDTDSTMISIGPNGTRISAKVYNAISWNSASIATRKLLMAVFDRKTLATHSMTGKPSPAFKDQGKPLKEMLDPMAIQDIIVAVTRKCNVSEKEVRNAITTKCADENKMMKLQMNKRTPVREVNKENVAAGCSKNSKSGLQTKQQPRSI